MQGMRQMRLHAKEVREEKEEVIVVVKKNTHTIIIITTLSLFSLLKLLVQERRMQLDIEEAQIQGQKRKEAIQKARKLQYQQTDRVKGLRAAVLLTEVLRERDLQAGVALAR